MVLKFRIFFKLLLLLTFPVGLIASTPLQQPATLSEIALAQLAKKKPDSDSRRGFAAPPLSTSYLSKISDLSEFSQLALKLDSDLGKQQIVKLIYDRRKSEDQHVYFFNTNTYSYHIEFAKNELGWVGSGGAFNSNYEGSGEKRNFNLATLALSPRSLESEKTEVLLEIWNGDSLSGPSLLELYQNVKKNLNPENFQVRFHPLSDLHLSHVKSMDSTIDFVTNDELYAGKEYWPLSRFDAVGNLKIIDELTEESLNEIEPSDIVVFLGEVPNEIGFVAGVVTSSFQTPLSHINIKSRNRKTANLSHKRAKEIFKPYEGKFIKLSVGNDKPSIDDLSHLTLLEKAEAIKNFWDSRRPSIEEKIQKISIDESDPSQTSFVDLRNVYSRLPNRKEHRAVIQNVGAKAANLGLLNYLSPKLRTLFNVEVPPALGLPFFFYKKFTEGMVTDSDGKRISLDQYIRQKITSAGLAAPGTIKSKKVVEPVLADIRNKYLEVEIPDEFFEVFKDEIFGTNTNSPIHITKKIPRIRLRSSTNSEDLEGFTGAGLYESAGVNLFKKLENEQGFKMDKPKSWKKIKKKLDKKIREVYSGVWNTRAYMEREWFGLDGEQHFLVMAALAVHQAFPFYGKEGNIHERANGVVATRNIYKSNQESGIDEIYINCQHWDLAVTNPPTISELSVRGEGGPGEGGDPIPYRTEENLITAYANNADVHNRPDVFRWWHAQKLKATSVHGGEAVLVDTPSEVENFEAMEARRLAGAFYFLERKMAVVYGKSPENYDIEGEWKILDQSRRIMIKQIREFPAPTDSSQGI